MSNATIPLSNKPKTVERQAERSPTASPTWWIVFVRELGDLWIGGKALSLTLVYCVLLGIWAYVLASNSELSLIPPKEMVFETLKAANAVSLFICLIIGADAIAGERERATFESLLLTPTNRRQIVLGKFLAAISPMPITIAITIPYWRVLAQGDEIFGQTVVWGTIFGLMLAPAFAALGMVVSLWCNSNKTSMFVSLGLYLFLFLPTQLPGKAQTGAAGATLQEVNPLAATTHFLAKILVNNSTFAEMWPWFVSPFVLALLCVGLLFYFGGELHLEAKPPKFSWGKSRSLGILLFVALLSALTAIPTFAQATASQDQPLSIIVNADYKSVKAGDPVLYDTVVTNNGAEASPALIVAMNIINLDAQGAVVDPEDWSPQRTQYIDSVKPGESVTLSWRINSILDGDYMVYMVLIPAPSGTEATSLPVASSGIHLTVAKFTRLNPGGVLPYAIGGPVVVLAIIYFTYRLRRRNVDMGEAEASTA